MQEQTLVKAEPKKQHRWSAVAEAKAEFERKARRYVRLHMEGAKKAAEKGDTRPVEWALEHIVALDDQGNEVRPIAPSVDRRQVETTHDSGPRVMIGFSLGAGFGQAAPLTAIAQNVTISEVAPTAALVESSEIIEVAAEVAPQDVGAKADADD